MEFEYFKLNRDRKIVKRMIINLDDYVAIVANGWDWKIFRKKGRPFVLHGYYNFDDFAKCQRQNDEAVERKMFSYIYNGDGRKISDKVRDEKGRPLKKYTQPEDILGEAIKLNYHDKLSDELWKYIEDRKMFFYSHEPWREILKDQIIVL